METFDDMCQKITTDITTEDAHTRSQYLNHFSQQVSEFSQAMSRAFLEWRELHGQLGGDQKKRNVSALVYCAVGLHISSMKLFLSGHTIPAGNLQRQVIETIALACLCSAKELDVLDRFIQDKYSTQHAIRDALRHVNLLRLNVEAVEVLERWQSLYHKYSHPSQLMIAHHMSISEGNILFGPVLTMENSTDIGKKLP
jgi:ABC-type transport system involved in cytochrome bd biosynthesis fused ATPase/permease subunit